MPVLSSKQNPRIIVALDFPDAKQALGFAAQLDPALCRVKIGKELFTRAGPALVETLISREFSVFLDLKFHDIPNTVAAACRAAAELGVWMLNVHASGGRTMLMAAREAVDRVATPVKPLLIAVTVLTSLSENDFSETGIQNTLAQQVLLLARLARDCRFDGVVCSAQEAAVLRKSLGRDFCLVTPGIRPLQSPADDQHRIMTPRAACNAGADYLVIGRPVTQAPDPLQVLQALNDEIGQRRLC